MKYKNGKITAFYSRKMQHLNKFIQKLYRIMKKSPDEYSLTVKTNVKSTHPTQPIDSLPIDIVDDEMVRVIMNSDLINYGCTPVYVMTTPKVPKELTLMPSNQTSSFEHYSIFRSYSDSINDNVVNTNMDNMHAKTYNIESQMNSRHCISPVNIVEDVDQFQKVNDPSQNHLISSRTCG